ncbi:MAG: hypothetical protein GY765_25010 [bacterium]|nr:hypothetical protein [bacterium]
MIPESSDLFYLRNVMIRHWNKEKPYTFDISMVNRLIPEPLVSYRYVNRCQQIAKLRYN